MTEHRTLIKICGITRVEDGLAALEAGADWLGVIRWQVSPRYRASSLCRDMVEELRERAGRPFDVVGVYVNQEPDEILEDSYLVGADRLQLHGDESMSLIKMMPLPVIKTIRMKDANSVARADEYPGLTLLADADDPIRYGGTGRRFDPDWISELTSRRRVIVAGGLLAGNVGELVRRLHPFGVDVSSGVELEPGIKDPQKIADFVAAVREGDDA